MKKFTSPQRRKIYENILYAEEKTLERGMCYLLSDIIGIWAYYGCEEKYIGTFPEYDLFMPDARDDNCICYADRIMVMQLCIEMTKTK